MASVPTFDAMMNPTIQALKNLGGSGTIEEIYHTVAEIMELPDEQLEILHDPERSSQTERLAWTRTYLKKYGVLENSSRGVWALTQKGRQIDHVNPTEVKRFVRAQDQEARAEETDSAAPWWDGPTRDCLSPLETSPVMLNAKPPETERQP